MYRKIGCILAIEHLIILAVLVSNSTFGYIYSQKRLVSSSFSFSFLVFFFFPPRNSLGRWVGDQSKRGLSQIWLQVREESRKV
jgi:hypothetical protein